MNIKFQSTKEKKIDNEGKGVHSLPHNQADNQGQKVKKNQNSYL